MIILLEIYFLLNLFSDDSSYIFTTLFKCPHIFRKTCLQIYYKSDKFRVEISGPKLPCGFFMNKSCQTFADSRQ